MSGPVTAATLAPEPYMAPGQLRPLPRGDQGTWARSTVAGQLAAVVAPDEPDWDAQEVAAARQFADDYEHRYDRRPAPLQARWRSAADAAAERR